VVTVPAARFHWLSRPSTSCQYRFNIIWSASIKNSCTGQARRYIYSPHMPEGESNLGFFQVCTEAACGRTPFGCMRSLRYVPVCSVSAISSKSITWKPLAAATALPATLSCATWMPRSKGFNEHAQDVVGPTQARWLRCYWRSTQ